MKPRLLACLGELKGRRVLDLGCGTGDDAREIAIRVGPGGSVLGIDLSEALIAEARQRWAGIGLPLEFAVGDAGCLTLPDASVDAVRIERLLMHVSDLGAVLREISRVLCRGGRLAVFDFDWDGMLIDHPDRNTTRRIVRSISDGMRNGWVGRQVARLLADMGLCDVTVETIGVPLLPWFLPRLLGGHLAKAENTGEFAPGELDDWWDALDRQTAAGHFLAICAGMIIAGARN
jgi:SAM-dependent methyltransferase